jgi:hypothetical protein
MPKTFKAYQHAQNEMALLPHLVQKMPTAFNSFLSAFFQLRWLATYPLQRRLPCYPSLTFGEVIFVLPLLFGYMVCIVSFGGTPSNPRNEAETTGGPASIFCGLAIITAMQNSVFTFAIGVPFERSLYYHKFFAWGE